MGRVFRVIDFVRSVFTKIERNMEHPMQGFENINDFAAHEARGEMYWGDIVEFDNSWKNYAQRNPNVDIIFLKFEDIVS